LTTLILGRTLWQTIWLNVLGEKDLQIRGASQERANKGDIFPWMAPTRTSGQDQNTTSTDVHPLQMYWSMPSRILLDSAEPSTASQNHLIKTESNTIFCSIKKKNHGTNYVGPWAHPLTPHRENGPVLGSAEVLSYRHWLGATITENKRQIRPAKVIRMAYRRASYSVVENTLGRRPQVWLFGYAMSNAKAEMWQDSTMPLFTVAPEVRVEFENFAHQLVNAADHLAGELKTALKRGLYGKKKNGGWDFAAHIKSSAEQKSVLDDTATRFWRDTEPLFFDYLSEAQSVLERNKDHDSDDDLTLDLRRKWLEGLREDHLLLLYDEVTASSTFHGADPKSVALARNELFWAAHESNDDIREKLNLPKE
jgi:CRISPR system Cascade subunit CasA